MRTPPPRHLRDAIAPSAARQPGLLLALLALAACAAPPLRSLGSLRLVSWNIRHAEGLDGRVDVERIGVELAALQPDIVCLQEVDVGVRRSQGIDIPRRLAEQLSMHAAFGKNIDYQGGDYGNAILCRWPIAWQHNRHYRMLRQGEQRGLLMAGVELGGAVLTFGCTHVDYRPDDSERRSNAEEILAELAARPLAAVAGDFNDHPDQPVHAMLGRQCDDCWAAAGGGDGFTFPSKAPDRRIDWVLVPRGGALRPRQARVGRTAASDHAPLVVDFELAPR